VSTFSAVHISTVTGQFADKPIHSQLSLGHVNLCTKQFSDSKLLKITHRSIIFSKFSVKHFGKLTSLQITQSAR